MTKTLIVDPDERFKMNSFILVRPQSDFYKVGTKFEFLDNKQLFISISYLKSVDNFQLSDIPEHICFLDQNVPKHLFIEIQRQVFKSSKNLTLKDHPHFYEVLKYYLGDQIFYIFEKLIFKDFKPLTLLQIVDLYKNQHYSKPLIVESLMNHIENSYDKKRLSVLTFSNRTP